MDATQAVNDSLFESDEEEKEEKQPNKARQPLAKLCILKNDHVPERGERQACSHQRQLRQNEFKFVNQVTAVCKTVNAISEQKTKEWISF